MLLLCFLSIHQASYKKPNLQDSVDLFICPGANFTQCHTSYHFGTSSGDEIFKSNSQRGSLERTSKMTSVLIKKIARTSHFLFSYGKGSCSSGDSCHLLGFAHTCSCQLLEKVRGLFSPTKMFSEERKNLNPFPHILNP